MVQHYPKSNIRSYLGSRWTEIFHLKLNTHWNIKLRQHGSRRDNSFLNTTPVYLIRQEYVSSKLKYFHNKCCVRMYQYTCLYLRISDFLNFFIFFLCEKLFEAGAITPKCC